MRTLITVPLVLALAVLTSGCASHRPAESAPAPTTPASQAVAGNTQPCIMQSAGRDVLLLTLPADAKWLYTNGSLHIYTQEQHVQVWLVPDAKTVADALARAPQVIASEFKKFQPATTTDLTIAGQPAKRLVGPGEEADDGDPGRADAIVFKTGPHIFIACTHGEHLAPADQQWLLTVVQTAQVP